MWCEHELARVTTQADESVVVYRRTLNEGLLNLVRCYHVLSRRCGGRQSPAGPRVGVSGAIILTNGAGHAGLRKQERQHLELVFARLVKPVTRENMHTRKVRSRNETARTIR